MALNGGGSVGLGFELSADDMMSGVLDKANAAVSRLHDGIGRLDSISKASMAGIAGIGMAIFSAGKGFLEGAFSMAKAGAPFEAAMHEVEHFSHATEEQMRDMNEAVFSAQNGLMGFTATDAAKALKVMAVETGDAKMALDRLEPALLLAGIAGKSAEQGAKSLNATMRVFNVDAKDAGKTVDQIAVAAKQFHMPAAEMEGALGRVSRGAKTVGASVGEAALVLGLFRSGSRSASEAAGAANIAFMALGNAKKNAALDKIIGPGVPGEVRSMSSVLGQLSEKMASMTDKGRIEALGKIFGPRSAGMMKDAIRDLAKGIDDGQGHMLKGTAAIKFLNEQMEHSAGAARKMLDAQLDTFEGQEKVWAQMRKSLETGFAAPLAGAFKPIIKAMNEGLAKVLEFFAGIDPETKKFIAQAVLVAGVVVTVLGAAFVFLGGPATLAVFALIAAGVALEEAYRTNMGGFADWVHETIGRVMMAFKALAQLFTKGSMDLDLFEQLRDDPALYEFVMNVFVAVNKVKAFFEGLVEGFTENFSRVKPSFDAFSAMLDKLAARFGLVSDGVDTVANGIALDKAGQSGKKFGEFLVNAIDAVVRAFTAVMEIIDGFASTWDSTVAEVKGAKDVFDPLVDTITELASELGLAGNSASTFSRIGELLGHIFTAAVSVVKWAVGVIAIGIDSLANIFGGVIEVIRGIVNGDWAMIWHGMKRIVFGVVEAIVGVVLSLVGAIASALDAIGHLAGKDLGLADKWGAYSKEQLASLKSGFGLDTPLVTENTGGAQARPAAKPFIAAEEPNMSVDPGAGFPAGAAAEGTGGAGQTEALQSVATKLEAIKSMPVNVTATSTVQLDTEVLATSVNKWNEEHNISSGVPQAP